MPLLNAPKAPKKRHLFQGSLYLLPAKGDSPEMGQEGDVQNHKQIQGPLFWGVFFKRTNLPCIYPELRKRLSRTESNVVPFVLRAHLPLVHLIGKLGVWRKVHPRLTSLQEIKGQLSTQRSQLQQVVWISQPAIGMCNLCDSMPC